MIDLDAIRRRLDDERRTLAGAGETLEIVPPVVRLRSADGSRHTIIASDLSPETADAAIAAQAAHHRALGAEVEWKVYAHDRPADLAARLARHGFAVGPAETVLVLDLHDRPAWIDEPPAHESRRVGDDVDVEAYRAAAEMIFGKDYGFTAGELRAHLRLGSTQHQAYVALDGGVVASIGRLYTHPQSAFGGLYGGATLKSHRGRGLYRATVAARARDATELGARYLIADALPTSRPILERLGFVRLTETWPCMLGPNP